MSKGSLTAAELRQLLHYEPETGVFTRLTDNRRGAHVGDVAGSDDGDEGYWRVYVGGRRHRAHRLAWLYMTGAWPKGEVDHKDLDKANNRWLNLRDVTRAVNQQNRRQALSSNVATGLLGVRPWGNRFAARITVDNKTRRVGVADTPAEAHALYVAAKRQLHEGNTL